MELNGASKLSENGAKNRDEASGLVVDHNGVTVIDDVKRRRLVIEADRGQVGFLRIADGNGRLAMPVLAQSKLLFEPPQWLGPCVLP